MAAGKVLQIKRGTASTLVTLSTGELGYTTDTKLLYIGDGSGNTLVGGVGVLRDVAAGITLANADLTLKGTPTADNMAATKAYVDAARMGIDVKASARVATVVDGTLATAFANGQIVDTVTLATGDRILIKNQTSGGAGADNGIYTVNVSGAPTRATDMPTGAGFSTGAFMFVEEGSQADTGWILTNNGAINIGVTALVFAQFSSQGSYTASLGVQKVGSDFRADLLSTGGLSLSTNSIQVKCDATAANLESDASGLRIKQASAQYKFMSSGATPFNAGWTDISTLAGAGLTAATGVLAVGAGSLVSVAADTVGVAAGASDYQFIKTTTTPWTPAYADISTLAGAGLVAATGVLAVGAGSLVSVAADTVGITPAAADYSFIKAVTTPWTPVWGTIDSLAGNGLTSTAGVLAVGAGTLMTVAADTIGHAAGASDYQFVGTTTTPWTAAYRNVSALAGTGLSCTNGVLAFAMTDMDFGSFQ